MAYKFRPRKYVKKYIESHLHDSGPNYSRPPSRRATKRVCRSRSRRLTRKNTRARENVTRNSGGDKSAKRGCLSKNRGGDRNNETSDDEPSGSCMKRGSFTGEEPSSPEGLNSSMKRRSSSLEGPSSVPKTILSWLIDCKMVEEDEEVCYMNGTKESATKTGRITRGGILCSCCHREMSVWAFEKHAGSDLKNPYGHIYLLRTGTCLLDCQTAAWDESMEQRRRQIEPFVPKETATDKNDDACLICGDGGALMCCDKCPSTFHPHCMNMEIVPQGGWLCPHCVCKYCGLGGECKQKQLITCSLCDKKFQWACFRELEKEAPKKALDLICSRLYCEESCREIHEKLESLVGVNNELDEGYSWRVIRPTDKSPSAARHQHVENNSKVAVAWTLMNESFDTIKDRYTEINMIQSVVYSRGSNLRRINFSHFYAFILEKEDEVICAASIRIHGARIAEMPFIATAENHRGQGFCGMLFAVIESNLCSLNAERLIIPSVVECCVIWSCKYGFKELSSEVRGEIASYSLLAFPFAARMQKDLTTPIAESDAGDANRGEQTINQNAQDPENQEPQNQVAQNQEAVRRPVPDLNLEPPEEEN